MFNPERAKWSAETFKAEGAELITAILDTYRDLEKQGPHRLLERERP